MKVIVTSKKFGSYKEGAEIEMHESTAKAVAKHGLVEIVGESDEQPKKERKNKK